MRHFVARQTLRVALALAVVALAVSMVGLAPRAAASNPAQGSKSLVWERYDVLIDQIDTAANRFRMTETYRLRIERGTFTFGTAEIPLDRAENITSLSVYENG
ncbi:MAG: hypothetical protein AAGU78_11390, partial [Chloroflexota bacterium]